MKRLWTSGRHAWRGMRVAFVSEPNLRIQIAVTMLVLLLASALSVKPWEFILLLLLCAAVITLELFNTVIERMADGLSTRLKPIIRDVKDIMASAVLLVSFVAVIVGVIIFVPYLLRLFGISP